MRRARSTKLLRAAAWLLGASGVGAGALVGCTAGDHGPPNPLGKPTLALDAGIEQDAGLLDGGPPKRTLEVRNPWGGPAGNLLADGDFEHSTVHPGDYPQAGWLAYTTSSQADIRWETGGLCRTGLRCAVLEHGETLVGFGVAANGTGMVASLWAKGPASVKCANVLTLYLVEMDSGTVVGAVKNVSQAPDADGWCHYQSSFDAARTARMFYVESKLQSGATALLDSAELVPDTGSVPLQDHVTFTAEQQQRLDRILDLIRRRQRFGSSAPEEPARSRPRQ